MEPSEYGRVEEIRYAVRRAVGQLRGLERRVIEGYNFDGMSFGRIAESESVSVNRVVTAHRQAMRSLRVILAPFVARTFGIGATVVSRCPICTSSWRSDAESIIDAKTPDVTWGQIVTRIERATGWRAKSPQVVIVHKRKHGTFEHERNTDDQTESAWGSCSEDQCLNRLETEFGEVGETDGPSACGCMPDSAVDGATDPGGTG